MFQVKVVITSARNWRMLNYKDQKITMNEE